MSAGLHCRGVGLELSDGRGGPRTVLREVAAAFPPGSVSVIFGATGAGKTSLLQVLACLARPTCGRVFADGRPVSAWTSAHQDAWRRSVGIAFQHPRLLERMSVLENVMLPLLPRGGRGSAMRRRARETMDRLGIVHLEAEAVHTLSGGEAQRVSLARALAAGPRFVLVDEPTSHQDGEGVRLVEEALHACRGRGAVVVATSHDRRLLDAGLPDRRYRLAGGRLEPVT